MRALLSVAIQFGCDFFLDEDVVSLFVAWSPYVPFWEDRPFELKTYEGLA